MGVVRFAEAFGKQACEQKDVFLSHRAGMPRGLQPEVNLCGRGAGRLSYEDVRPDRLDLPVVGARFCAGHMLGACLVGSLVPRGCPAVVGEACCTISGVVVPLACLCNLLATDRDVVGRLWSSDPLCMVVDLEGCFQNTRGAIGFRN